MAGFFIRRPIVAIVIAILIVLLGGFSLKGLSVEQYPFLAPPNIRVTANYPGASALSVEQSVATPIEQEVNGVENMIYMKSSNTSDGRMQLDVNFGVGVDQDMANVLTQNRVSAAQARLPQDVVAQGVTVKKMSPSILMLISLYSPKGTYDANFLINYCGINLRDQILRIPGIAQVDLFGGTDYGMRIWLRPDRMAQLGVTPSDVISAIKEQNLQAPAGRVGMRPSPKDQENTYTVSAPGRLINEDEFANIIIRETETGAQIRIKDVGQVELGSQDYNSFGRLDGKPAGAMAVYLLPGANQLQAAEGIYETMERAKELFPSDVDYKIVYDTTPAVKASIESIIHTFVEALILVTLVVFIFLQNLRATLIPLLTVPVSLVGTFIFFPMLGFSINTLSMFGLVLAIGIVVDDAIVVVEAVMHHLEHGMNPREATIKAMEEVSGPVIAIGLILCAVFVPVGFMGGITGRLYQQFAITIALSVLLSVVNALTLSPALAAMLLKAPTGKKTLLTPFYNGFNKIFGWTTDRYVSFSAILIRKMFRSAAFIAVLCFVIVALVRNIPSGFVPEEDQGFVLVNTLLPDAASLERTDAVMKKAEAILKKTETVDGYNTISGFSLVTGAYSSNMGFFFVQLKPWEERGREHTAAAITAELNREFQQEIREGGVVAFGPPAIPGLGTGAGFTFELQDRSGGAPDYLAAQSQKFIEAARKRPEIGRISTLYRASVPQIYADIDRDKVTKSGVPLADVNTTLGALLGSSYINDFNKFGRVYKVYVQAEPEFRRDTSQLGLFYVRNQTGGMVPLDTLVSTRAGSGPEFTNRFNLFRTAEITGVPAPGVSSAQALDALEATAREVLPPDMSFDWADMSYQERKAPGVAVVFALAIFLVFLILAAQYESWGLPFSVLLGTPFAAVGAYGGLWIARQLVSESYVNNIFAQIGLIMLIGLAAKNAILIVEFAKMERDAGKPLVESALLAAKLRLRPILMTAFAFILGVVPLLTASGAGAESRKVMGVAVFAGMLIATILGVCLIPMLYVAVERVTGSKTPALLPPAGEPALAGVGASHGGH